MKDFISGSEYLNSLLTAYRKDSSVKKTFKLRFDGVDGFDVYNISNEFCLGGKRYIAGRVEKRDSESSDVVIFEKCGADRYTATDIRFADLQDPCFTMINGQPVLGGTKIYFDVDGNINNWNTTFFKGEDLENMSRFADAPKKMKDVRLLSLNNVIHVFTRPQGGMAKAGRIGHVTVPSFSDVGPEVIASAPLIGGLFDDLTWGGVNQATVLSNGKIGVLGHIAVMSEGDVRHYLGMTFAFDPKTGRADGLKIICERGDFPEGEYKRKDLVDVVFVGGLNRNGDGTADLYVGLSDAEAYRATIIDPFTEYEDR